MVSGEDKKERASNAKRSRCMCMEGKGRVEGEEDVFKQMAKMEMVRNSE